MNSFVYLARTESSAALAELNWLIWRQNLTVRRISCQEDTNNMLEMWVFGNPSEQLLYCITHFFFRFFAFAFSSSAASSFIFASFMLSWCCQRSNSFSAFVSLSSVFFSSFALSSIRFCSSSAIFFPFSLSAFLGWLLRLFHGLGASVTIRHASTPMLSHLSHMCILTFSHSSLHFSVASATAFIMNASPRASDGVCTDT